MLLIPIKEGRWSAYTPCDKNGKSSLLLFAETVGVKYRSSLGRLFSIIETACESNLGPTQFNDDISHFVNTEHKILEFIAGDLRLLWFYSPGSNKVIICSHVFLKKSQKIPRKDIRQAIKLKKAYVSAEKNGQVEIVKEIKED